MPTFRQFLHKVKEGGGTVLLYLGEEDVGPREERDPAVDVRLDGCIALGAVRGVAAELGAPLLARVERPMEPAISDDPPDRSETGDARPPEASGTVPEPVATAAEGAGPLPGSLSRLWIPLVALLLLWAAWTLFGPDRGPRAEAEAAEGAEGAVPGETENGSAGNDGGAPTAVDPSARREFSAPPATYSILVGSYIRLGDAMQRRDELASDGGLFLVTPTPVQGRVYQRVLAGVFEDRTQAIAAMQDLVADGRKELVKDWDIRPVRLAYSLGTFAGRDSARHAAERYTAEGIPAYVLRDTARTPLYRVYAGAFEREASATPLRDVLEARGSAAQLNVRTGVAP